MKRLWQLGGIAALLAAGAAGGGMAIGASFIDSAGSLEALLQAVAQQPMLWRIQAALTALLTPALILAAQGALFDLLIRRGAHTARSGVWLGAAGMALLFLAGALQYVAYPRMAAAFVENPALALEVFRPLRLADETLLLFAPLVGIGIPALLAALAGWRRAPLLLTLAGIAAFAGQIAALVTAYQMPLLTQIALGLAGLWLVTVGLTLLMAHENRAATTPKPASSSAQRATAAGHNATARSSARPAAAPDRSAPGEPAAAADDPYTPAPAPLTAPVETQESDRDHARWKPPQDHHSGDEQ